MVQEHTPALAEQLIPLFQPLNYHLEVRSILEGSTPAVIFSDRPDQPRLAMLWDHQDAVYISAASQDVAALSALRAWLHLHVLPQARSRWIPRLSVSAVPALEPMLPALLEGLEAEPADRLRFHWPAGRAVEVPPDRWLPPPGFVLAPIDRPLLESERANARAVRGWVESFWPSINAFLRSGFGWCALETASPQAPVAAWCLTVFGAGEERELGLETAAPYRRLGLGALVAAHCLHTGIQRGFTIHWHCWKDNLPSARIAESLGFTLERRYTSHRVATGFTQPAQS
jgi:GNAT superfamily N-acetyltransferase